MKYSKDVTQIFSTTHAFAALRSDGSVVTWGSYGGNSSAVAAQLNGADDSKDVTGIFSTYGAFAALRADSSVITWGDSAWGGDSSAVTTQLNGTDDSKDVTGIFSTSGAFAALRIDGSVITWGDSAWGGDSSTVAAQLDGTDNSQDVTQIFLTAQAFAALRADGSVVTWGGAGGGDSSAVATQLNGSKNVTQIFSNFSAFAALRADGSVVTWGDSTWGGDSSAVATQLNGADDSKDVIQIFSTAWAFAALRADGSVITWGGNERGGDSSAVVTQLNGADDSKDVIQIFSTTEAFTALRADGSVVTWGNSNHGGDSSAVAAQLDGTDDSQDVTQIFATEAAFAALRADGSVVTWGDSGSGGNSSTVATKLAGTNDSQDVTQIFSTPYSFAALRADGSVVTWGGYGGDSSVVANQINSGVVWAADIYTDDVYHDPGLPPTVTNLNASESYVKDVALNLTDITVTDIYSATITATLTLSNPAAGRLNTATSGAVTSTFNNGVWTASGALEDVNALLSGVTFTPANNFNANFTIETRIADGRSDAVTGSKSFTGTAVADIAVSTGIAPVEGGNAGTFTVILDSPAPVGGLTVNYALAGTATLNVDYTMTAGSNISTVTGSSFTVAEGQSSATLIVDVPTDTVADPNEIIDLYLNAGTGYQFVSSVAFTLSDRYNITDSSLSRSTQGDFNNDGKVDLAVVDGVNVSVQMRNAEDTGYEAPIVYKTNPEVGIGLGGVDGDPQSIAAGDFNNDGQLDLAIANTGGHTALSVSILLRNNANTDFDKLDFLLGFRPDLKKVGDFNNDGKLDLALSNYDLGQYDSGQLAVLLNTSKTNSSLTISNATPTVGTDSITPFTEQIPVTLTNIITINDANGDTDWNTGTLQVQITANNTADDNLALPITNNGGIWLNTTGNVLMADTTIIGNANAATVSNGSAWQFSFNAAATNALVQDTARTIQFVNNSDTPSISDRTITFTVADKDAASSSAMQTVSITAVNDIPTLTTFASSVASGNEDNAITISFTALKAQGNETDIDGSVTAFTIKSLSSGYLKIGTSIDTATNWNATTNNTIDTTHNAYWTADANVNGILNAFTVTAKDNGGLESATAIQATVNVAPINDAPILTLFSLAVASGFEDSTNTVTFTDLQDQGDQTDIDGNVESFVVKAVSSGSLKIGTSAETATSWNITTNNLVNTTLNAYWIPAVNASGLLNAFTVTAKDNGSLESATAIQAKLAIAAVNDAPTLTAFSSIIASGNEDNTIIVSFAALQTQGNEADIDDTVTSFVIKAVTSGSLRIGSSVDTATDWNAITNNIVDATHNAYWTAAANTNGLLNAFTAVAKDGGGLESASAIQAQIVIAADNDAPTGTVTIIGTATQEQTLTVSNTLADADGLGAISYQWQADGKLIGSGNSYVLTQADVGKTMTVSANYTDNQGNVESVNSVATAAVANINDLPTGTVTISGVVKQGAVLTASNTLADKDGLGTVSYVWKANDIPLSTANSQTLTQAEVGKTITLTANYTDNYGAVESKTSTATAPVLNVDDLPAGEVTIFGIAQQGEILTVSNTLADADGLGAVSYQWKANGAVIGSGNSYTLTQTEVGKIVTAVALYTDLLGSVDSKASAATTAIANINDLPGGTVTISGTVKRGEVLTASNTLADADGLGPISYQWQADGTVIGSGKTYLLTNAEVGKTVTVTASYLDKGNTAETVSSSVTASVAKNFTNLTIYGDQAGSKADVLSGMNGNDSLYGKDMNDKLSGDEGNDILYGGYGNDSLYGGEGNDTFYGEQDADYLQGDSGNDTLDGGLGKDTLIGGSGNDTYYLGYDVADVINDQGSISDMDTVIMPYQLSSYTLPANIEIGTITAGSQASDLIGNELDNTLTGNNGDNALNGAVGRDSLFGGSGNDELVGGSDGDSMNGGLGNDILNGGTGNDTLIGGAGNDTYVVDSVNDVITESSTAAAKAQASAIGSGSDTVQSSVDWVLGNNLEKLILTGNAISGTGNSLANTITGNAGNNSLNGGAGADKLIGGLGNDIYFVDNVYDVVTETSALKTELDTVNSSVAYTLGANLENLTLTGTAALKGTGNALNNVIVGNAGANILNGGLGADVLTGGAGKDIFKLTTLSKDTVTDFSVLDDTIQLENGVFTKLGNAGVLKVTDFRIGSKAVDSSDYLIYNSETGVLSYDADGSGAGAAAQIALLGVHLSLTNADFVVI